MIPVCGIGIDSVSCARFIFWNEYSRKSLERILSPQEIDYCHSAVSKEHKAQRFATHFAVREAFFKALHHCTLVCKIAFLTLCRSVFLSYHQSGCPYISCDEQFLRRHVAPAELPFISRVSITHTHETVTVCVIILKS